MKYLFYLLLLTTGIVAAQDGTTTISGRVTSNGEPVAFASVFVKGGSSGTSADVNGEYKLKTATGKVKLVAQLQGYRAQMKNVTVNENESVVNFDLEEHNEALDEIVVTGTRTEKEEPIPQ